MEDPKAILNSHVCYANNELEVVDTHSTAKLRMRNPTTLDEFIKCLRIAQHEQPQQSNSAKVAKMVSAIILEQLSEFGTTTNAMQFNNSRYQSQSPSQAQFQSLGRDPGTQRDSHQTSQQHSCGNCGKSHLQFQCPVFNQNCTFCKMYGLFQVCATGLKGVPFLL